VAVLKVIEEEVNMNRKYSGKEKRRGGEREGSNSLRLVRKIAERGSD
jgi:hypothetical protein